jgi:UDP-N-acetylmuramoyl-tripeptide--D-alanyl-D-alanine ligase
MQALGQRILWLRARDYLRRYRPTVVGITGSSGVEVAKAALALALADSRHVRTAPANMQTRVGVALATLGTTSAKVRTNWLRLLSGSRLKEFAEEEPTIIVLALGGDKPGDIDFFARQLPVSVAVVTQVQSHSLHLYQNLDLIAHEYASLVASLPRESTACLNRDDPRVAALADKTKAKVLWYGRSAGADVRLVRSQRMPRSGFAVEFVVQGKSFEVHLPHLVSAEQLTGVAAALAAVVALGSDVRRAAERLSQLKPPRGDMRRLAGKGGAQLLDDSSNATPESMLASLGVAQELSAKRRIVILGGIENLGAETHRWHERIGLRAAEVSDIFIAVGDTMRQAGAVALKTDDTDVHHFQQAKDVGKWLEPYLGTGDLVLICGDRAARMEEVTKRLLADPADESQLVK